MQTSWTCIHSFNFKLILLKLQRTTVKTIKCCYLRFEKNCFNDGGGNTSPLKVLLLFSTLYYSIFAGFGLTRVSTDGAHFLFYPLCTINYTSSQFAPAYLFASASATSGVRRPPPYQIGIRNIDTASPPTSDEVLTAAEPLHLPPRFWRRIYCCACRHLWRRPPFSLTFAISRRYCRLLWLPIAAYLMSPLLIYSNLSVPPPVSLSFDPPIFLETQFVPSHMIIGSVIYWLGVPR